MNEFNFVSNNNKLDSNSKNNNNNLCSLKTNMNDNIKMMNIVKLNTPINGNNLTNNLSTKNFDTSKTFSTRNANGKKIVFNEKQERTEMINNNIQLINQQNSIHSNNTKNYNITNPNNNLIEKSNNLNRFTKIGKEHTNILVQKSTDKIKNLFANKFA